MAQMTRTNMNNIPFWQEKIAEIDRLKAQNERIINAGNAKGYNPGEDPQSYVANVSIGNDPELVKKYNSLNSNTRTTASSSPWRTYSRTGNVFWDIQRQPEGKYYLFLNDVATTIEIPLSWIAETSDKYGRLNQRGVAYVAGMLKRMYK